MKTIQKSDFYKVAIAAILVEDGFNVREDLKGVDELAKSIATVGQKTPIEGYKVRGEDKFVLTKGHRRLAAIKLANEKYIGKPGYLEDKITHVNLMAGSSDEKDRTIGMLLDGEASQPLTNKEMVQGISRLIEMGTEPKEIVRSLALTKSTAQAYNLIAAAKAPKAVQQMIDAGFISVAKVNALQRSTTSDKELIEAVENFVNEKEENKGKPKAEKKEKAEKKSDVALLEEALELVENKTSAKALLVKGLIRKLKAKASAEEIASLLK